MEVVQHWRMLPIRHCEFGHDEGMDDKLIEYRFVKILVIEIFSSVLGLFGLIIGLLLSGKANDFA